MTLEPKCEVLWPLKNDTDMRTTHQTGRIIPCKRPVVGVVTAKTESYICSFRVCEAHRDVALTPENQKYWSYTPNTVEEKKQ